MKINKCSQITLGIDIYDRMYLYLIEGDTVNKLIFKNRDEVKDLIKDLQDLLDEQQILLEEHR